MKVGDINTSRIIVAALLAPLTPAILCLVGPVLITLSWPFNSADYKIVLYVSSTISYSFSYLFGAPAVLILRKYAELNFINLAIAGFVIGAVGITIPVLILGLFYDMFSIRDFSMGLPTFCGLMGLSVSLVFAFISGLRNLELR